MHFLAATPELVRLRLALINPQCGHVDVDADEAPQPMASSRWYGDAVGHQPAAERAREVGIRPPALVVVVGRTRCKFR